MVTVTYIAPANAGVDQSACNITSTTLKAANPSPANGTWTQVSGPNAAVISNANNNETVVSGLIIGSYTFRWTVSSGSCSSTDDVVINVNTTSAVADAGPDFSICNGSTNNKILLNATAAGTGLTGTWAITSFPSGAVAGTFSNLNDPKAIYSGATVGGTYIFSWTLSDGTCTSTDFVTVTVNPTSCITISGTVFNDVNINTLIDGSETGTTAGTNLYVYLVNVSGVITDSAKVNSDGTYTLDASQNTAYTIELSTIQYSVGTNTGTTPIVNTPPSGWITTGENGEGNKGIGDGTPDGVLAVTTGTTNVTEQNFGLMQPDTNPDVNITWVDVSVNGNVNNNDVVPAGTSYGTPVLTSSPSGSTPVITLNPDGTYIFTGDVPGVYVYQVPVCVPGMIPPCTTSTLTITVLDNTSQTNPPVANVDIATTPLNTPVTLNTLSNDAPGNTSFSLNPASVTITDAPNNGTAVVDPLTGNITYTPNTGFTGNDTLIYSVCDTQTPPKCATAQQIITVLPAGSTNTTTATDDYVYTPFNTPVSSNALSNDYDAEGNLQTATPQTTTIPGKGTLVLTSDGNYTFTPEPGFSGPIQFPYSVCDNGVPQACATAIIHILVGPSEGPMPVTLVSFTALAEGSQVNIRWDVANEIGIKNYEVMFSTNGINFNSIGKLYVLGSSSYHFTHNTPVNGNNYYRLKITDADGKVRFSDIRIVKYSVNGSVEIYPNPVRTSFNISFSGKWQNKDVKLYLYNQAGQILYNKEFRNTQQTEKIVIQKLPSGTYILRMQQNDQSAEIREITIIN